MTLLHTRSVTRGGGGGEGVEEADILQAEEAKMGEGLRT